MGGMDDGLDFAFSPMMFDDPTRADRFPGRGGFNTKTHGRR